MSKWAGVELFRILFATLIGGFVALSGLPDAAWAHADKSNDLHIIYDGGTVPDDHADTEITGGHCHPGLDCFTVAAFLMAPSLPSPSKASEAKVWFIKLENDRWIPSSDKPPPRYFS